MKILNEKFYARHAEIVAKELLGNLLIRPLGDDLLVGRIVETEAYHGIRDTASRSYGGKKNNISKYMWNKPGTVFVYMVHSNWMINLITGKEDEASGVLIRAVEPLQGIATMFKLRRKKNKRINDVKQLCSGPGKLTQAFDISPKLQEKNATHESEIYVVDDNHKFKMGKSNRIGVTNDLKKKLRFFILQNNFVSK